MSEAELGARVAEHFQERGWEVYQEVKLRGPIADLVVTTGALVGVVECKASFGFAVLDQAVRWLPYAHRVWVATSAASRYRVTSLAAKGLGVGWLLGGGQELVAPGFNRRILPDLKKALRPEHQRGWAQAGAPAEAERFTPFKATCLRVLSVAQERPGIRLAELIRAIDHHYATDSTARGSLKTWIERGKVPGVRLRRDGRALTVWPEGKGEVV